MTSDKSTSTERTSSEQAEPQECVNEWHEEYTAPECPDCGKKDPFAHVNIEPPDINDPEIVRRGNKALPLSRVNSEAPDVQLVEAGEVPERDELISRGAARIAIDKLKTKIGSHDVPGYEERCAHNEGLEKALCAVENLPTASRIQAIREALAKCEENSTRDNIVGGIFLHDEIWEALRNVINGK